MSLSISLSLSAAAAAVADLPALCALERVAKYCRCNRMRLSAFVFLRGGRVVPLPQPGEASATTFRVRREGEVLASRTRDVVFLYGRGRHPRAIAFAFPPASLLAVARCESPIDPPIPSAKQLSALI